MGFFGFGKKEATPSRVNWVKLQSEAELDQLIQKESFDKPVALFKHSTHCSISSMALNRLETDWDIDLEALVPVYLDLIQFRSISNKIAADLGIPHQSPQLLLVKNGKCIYNASHSQIYVEDIKDKL